MNFNEGLFVIGIRADGQEHNPNVEAQRRRQQRQEQRQQQVQAAAAADEDPDPNAAAAEAAEQLIEINAASLGRRVGGALIIPYISSFMGNLLFRLSKHSGILRSFLGIRPTKVSWTEYMLLPWDLQRALSADKEWDDLDTFEKVKKGLHHFIDTFTIGSRSFVGSDPVWYVFLVFFFFFLELVIELILQHRWRNAVGIGIFIVVCFYCKL